MSAPRDDLDRERGPGAPSPTNAAANEPARTLRDEDIRCERRAAGPAMARDALERVLQRERRRARAHVLDLPRAGSSTSDDGLEHPLAAE